MQPSRIRERRAARPVRLAFAAVVLVALSSGACSTLAGGPPNPFDDAEASQVRIIVINNDFNDATLFARGNGERRRLGVVTGKTEASYVIPWRITGPLQIEISILAAGSCTTSPLEVDPGDVLELQILNEGVRGGVCSGLRGRG
jgi:hypothetical protein